MLGPLREGAPRRIGPYEVLARLGAGGMGEVFLGRAAADSSAGGGSAAAEGSAAGGSPRLPAAPRPGTAPPVLPRAGPSSP